MVVESVNPRLPLPRRMESMRYGKANLAGQFSSLITPPMDYRLRLTPKVPCSRAACLSKIPTAIH